MIQSRAKSLLTSGILFVLALFLTAYSSRRPGSSRVGQELVLELSRPFYVAAGYVSGGVLSSARQLSSLGKLVEENEELQAANADLLSEVIELREMAAENKRLHGLVQFIEQRSLRGVTARIVGTSVSPWRREIVIAAGSLNGIKRGQGVISTQGVVGRVSAVSQSLSRVLLISDPSSGVAALLASNRAPGIVVGRGEQHLELRYLPPDIDINEGTQVLTSGFDTVFPSGIPLGKVLSIRRRPGGLFTEVTVRAAVVVERLEEVLILTDEIGAQTENLHSSNEVQR